MPKREYPDHAIAVIGMAGRFPGARNIDEFWKVLREGRETISDFSLDEILATGIDPEVARDSTYIRRSGRLEDSERFDAAFFGMSPTEAQVTDPQQRLFLETAWEVMELAGYDPFRLKGRVGVFAGSAASTYALLNIASHRGLIERLGYAPVIFGTDKDYVPTRVAYKLNLRGPSLSINTACSTSLVAVHVACQSLLQGECEMALAGGVCAPTFKGYFHQEGSALSPDGHCRPFDVMASGTVPSSGVGAVLLRPLADALENGDSIHAIILGSAVNNDGAFKVSYTAPSLQGQVEAISEAMALAGVEADSIGYIEAHGTGTALGDPIEVSALTQAFRQSTSRSGYCGLGSLKSNVGHMDSAAGVGALLKAILCVKHGERVSTVHFQAPSPRLEIGATPFFVVKDTAPWTTGSDPRRAGVSAFGVGGTNAHVVIEEPPAAASPADRPWQLLCLSARSPAALGTMAGRLADHLEAHPEQPLADVAYTLMVGRTPQPHRRMVLCKDGPGHQDAIRQLRTVDGARTFNAQHEARERPIAFVFGGGGAAHTDMGLDLYRTEPVYREAVDLCCNILNGPLGVDIRGVMFSDAPGGRAKVKDGGYFEMLVALGVVEYALAKLWISWGIEPSSMIGYSTGEYIAACLSGVMSVEDCFILQGRRARLAQERLGAGGMLAVPLSESECEPFVAGGLSLAAINGPGWCILSGPVPLIESATAELVSRGLEPRRLPNKQAYHSSMLDPHMAVWREYLRGVKLSPPQRTYISTITGKPIRPGDATDLDYWMRGLRNTVRFGDGLAELLRDPDMILLEVGPAIQMTTLAKQHAAARPSHAFIASMRHPQEQVPDDLAALRALGKLWLAGVTLDGVHMKEGRRRVPLPTYPFERRRYYIDAAPWGSTAATDLSVLAAGVESAPAVELSRAEMPYQAPRNELERTLCELWEKSLGVKPVGITDNFFALGGTSLIGLKMFSLLPAELKSRVRLQDLMTLQTVESLAAHMSGTQQESLPSTVLRLSARSAEARARAFLLPPVFGSPYAYVPLLNRLGQAIEAFGFQAQGVTGAAEPLTTLDAIVSLYLEHMKAVQPRGPYRIIGYSLGGLLAFELAARLSRAGEEVPLLVAIDPPCRSDLARVETIPDSLAGVLAALVKDVGGVDLPGSELAGKPLAAQLAIAFQAASGQNSPRSQLPAGIDAPVGQRLLHVAASSLQSVRGFQYPSFPGRAILIEPSESMPGTFYPAGHIRELSASAAAGAEVHRVPGNHLTMMEEPHVEALAALLHGRLG
jgi:acyl transferase domain-containing protein/thioesterase domain-containing protein